MTLLQRASIKLKEWGGRLDGPDPVGNGIAEKEMPLIPVRVANVLQLIIKTSPRFAQQVGEQLLIALSFQDTSIRALGVLNCGLEGIPRRLIAKPLQRLFLNEKTEIVVAATSTILCGMVEGISWLNQLRSRTKIAGLIKRYAPDIYSNQVNDRILFEYRKVMLEQVVPRLIALQ